MILIDIRVISGVRISQYLQLPFIRAENDRFIAIHPVNALRSQSLRYILLLRLFVSGIIDKIVIALWDVVYAVTDDLKFIPVFNIEYLSAIGGPFRFPSANDQIPLWCWWE